MRFVFDGVRIKEDDTPKSLELEDEDTIEVCYRDGRNCVLRIALIALFLALSLRLPSCVKKNF